MVLQGPVNQACWGTGGSTPQTPLLRRLHALALNRGPRDSERLQIPDAPGCDVTCPIRWRIFEWGATLPLYMNKTPECARTEQGGNGSEKQPQAFYYFFYVASARNLYCVTARNILGPIAVNVKRFLVARQVALVGQGSSIGRAGLDSARVVAWIGLARHVETTGRGRVCRVALIRLGLVGCVAVRRAGPVR